MKNELTCEVVEDLLPSYVEGLTNEVTNGAVRAHMEDCENCRGRLDRIKMPDWQEDRKEEKEIDYLKKTRSGYHKKTVVGILIAAVIFFVLCLVLLSVVSAPVKDASLLDFTIKVDENEKYVYFCGNLMDSSKGISNVSYELEDGVLNISFRETVTSIFYKNVRAEHYYYEGELKQVRVENRIVWDHGNDILPDVADIYATKHLYIGAASDNGSSLESLGVQEKFGDYTMELHTTGMPYGLTLLLEENYREESAEEVEKWMRSYASAMIALTDNMGYMEFVYRMDGKEETFTVTEQQADQLVGQSVKEMAENVVSFQKLMGDLNLVREVALYEK